MDHNSYDKPNVISISANNYDRSYMYRSRFLYTRSLMFSSCVSDRFLKLLERKLIWLKVATTIQLLKRKGSTLTESPRQMIWLKASDLTPINQIIFWVQYFDSMQYMNALIMLNIIAFFYLDTYLMLWTIFWMRMLFFNIILQITDRYLKGGLAKIWYQAKEDELGWYGCRCTLTLISLIV